MNFMESVTLVNMLPQGFKHSTRRLASRRLLHRFMMIAMLLCSTCNAVKKVRKLEDYQPKKLFGWVNTKWLWMAFGIVAAIAAIIGLGVPANGGASDHLKFLLISIGLLSATIGTLQFLRCHKIGKMFGNVTSDEGAAQDTTSSSSPKLKDVRDEYRKWQWISQIFMALMLICVVIALGLAGQPDPNDIGGKMLGKSMVMLGIAGSSCILGFLMYQTHFDQEKDDKGLYRSLTSWTTGIYHSAKDAIASSTEGKTTLFKFLFASRTFWIWIVTLILVITVGAGTGGAEYGDQAFVLRMSILIPGITFLLGSLAYGVLRYNLYNKFETHDEWKDKELNGEAKSKFFARYALMGFFVMILVVGIWAGSSPTGLGQSNGMVLGCFLALLGIGITGSWFTIKTFLKHKKESDIQGVKEEREAYYKELMIQAQKHNVDANNDEEIKLLEKVISDGHLDNTKEFVNDNGKLQEDLYVKFKEDIAAKENDRGEVMDYVTSASGESVVALATSTCTGAKGKGKHENRRLAAVFEEILLTQH